MSIRPTFYGLEIARSGLTVSQKGLDVTGHNISNVDTAGYTRQRIISTAYDPYNAVTQFKPVDRALIGAGAYVKIHDQVRSAFLDRQFRTEQSLLSNWSIRTQGLNYVEALYENGESASLADGINSLFSAFNIQTNESSDEEQRVNIQNAASNFAQNLNIMYSRLMEQQDNQNLAVDAVITKINTIAQSIGELNKSIYSYELDGKLRANDLRDKRNLLLDELSALVDIEYEEYAEDPSTPNHTKLKVTIGGETLVNHLTVNKLECVEVPNTLTGEANVLEPRWATGPNAGGVLKVSGGELRGHLDLRDSNSESHQGIPYYVEQLNNLARSIAKEINEVHRIGFTHPSGTVGGSISGINFFYAGAKQLRDTNGNLLFEEISTFNQIYLDVDGSYKYVSTGNIANVTAADLMPLYEQDEDENGNPLYKDQDGVIYYPDGMGDYIKMATGETVSAGSLVLSQVDKPDYDSVTAGNLRLSDEVLNSVYNIASSTAKIVMDPSDPNQMIIGNQENMRTIYDLINKTGIKLNAGTPNEVSINTFQGYVTGMLLDIALSLEHSKDRTQTLTTQCLAVDNQRLSISGVSLDEEMTQLIKYQHAFNGCSRVLTTMDDALDTIINRMGRVGL